MQYQPSHSSPSPSLNPLSPTRWTVHTGAINAVLANYEVLCDALCKIHEEGHGYDGRGYFACNGEV